MVMTYNQCGQCPLVIIGICGVQFEKRPKGEERLPHADGDQMLWQLTIHCQ